MPLLIDTDVVTQQDLQNLEPDLANITSAVGITVTGDNGIIRKSWMQSTDELESMIQAFGVDNIAWPGTLTTYGAFGSNRPRFRMNQVVIQNLYGNRTPPLYNWLIRRALTLLYEECKNKTEKDRYVRKWTDSKDTLHEALRRLWSTGLPYVALPLECPGSLHALMAGTWGTTASYSLQTGGGFGSSSPLNVAITWVDQPGGYISPLNKNNCESGPSVTVQVTVPSGDSLVLNINGLNPPVGSANPNGIQPPRGIADGPYVTRAASGWNVYAGLQSDSQMYLQNASPIPVGTSSYTLSSLTTGTLASNGPGAPLLAGQTADLNATFQKLVQRG